MRYPQSEAERSGIGRISGSGTTGNQNEGAKFIGRSHRRRELTMQQPTNYRAQAAECLRRAEAAKNPEHRSILLQQAETLLRMAVQAAAINNRPLTSDDGFG